MNTVANINHVKADDYIFIHITGSVKSCFSMIHDTCHFWCHV